MRGAQAAARPAPAPALSPLLLFLLFFMAAVYPYFIAVWVGLWCGLWYMAYMRAGRWPPGGALLGLLAFAAMLLLGFAEINVWDWWHAQAE
jgi:hypothetical protein